MSNDYHGPISFIYQIVYSFLNLILTLSIQSRSSLIKDHNLRLFCYATGQIISQIPMAILCFCPPESLTPLQPTKVSSFQGKSCQLNTNSFAFAVSNAKSTILSLFAVSLRPYQIFSLRLPEKSVGYCETNPICCLSFLISSYFIFLPLILISPSFRSQNLRIRLTIEDLPEPEGPTIATDYPHLIFRLILFSTYTVGLVGQQNEALTNSTIFPLSYFNYGAIEPGTILTSSSIIQKMCSQIPIAEIVWLRIPEILANPIVSVMVQSTKLVRSPIVNSSSITSLPPKQSIIKMRTFAKIVVMSNIIPQKKSFLRPVLYTLSNNAEQFLLSRFSFENERTTRMLPNTSVANEVVKAKLLEYYFCSFFIFFITISTPNDIIGVRTIITRVSFQLISHRNSKLPINCKKLRSSIERLSEQTEQTVVISLPNLERSYPVLF